MWANAAMALAMKTCCFALNLLDIGVRLYEILANFVLQGQLLIQSFNNTYVIV